MKRTGVAMMLAIIFWAVLASLSQEATFDGIEYVGRWTGLDSAHVATYGGSTVLLKFRNSSSARLDLTTGASSTNVDIGGKLYIRVIVDGGAPERVGLDHGAHPGYLLASGLSAGTHLVEVRYDQEPEFGALRVGHASLDQGGNLGETERYAPDHRGHRG